MFLTTSERVSFKRCQTQWFWRWRKGLVPIRQTLGPLLFGQWLHEALAFWYGSGYARDAMPLWQHFEEIATAYFRDNPPVASMENKAEEMLALGVDMCKAYQEHYADDPDLFVIAPELSLNFTLSDNIVHGLKPDLIVRHRRTNKIWMVEHKSAATIKVTHLPIDDQAIPYVAMAERALQKQGVIGPDEHIEGILYNFLRKAFQDMRATDGDGRYLNKNGTISKRQPPAYFRRKEVRVPLAQKQRTLRRLFWEAHSIAQTTETISKLTPDGLRLDVLGKTPHKTCERFCEYFSMCVAHDQGRNWQMHLGEYHHKNPYDYHTESVADVATFDLG